jgi:hypothetical protein
MGTTTPRPSPMLWRRVPEGRGDEVIKLNVVSDIVLIFLKQFVLQGQTVFLIVLLIYSGSRLYSR